MNNSHAKFHPYLIWNDGDLVCFEERRPSNKMSINMESVTDPKSLQSPF